MSAARHDVPPELLARAGYPKGRPGRLTRRNTVPGSVERSAVDRVTYERRQAERRPGETARAGAGHAVPGTGRDVVPVFVASPARLLLGAERDRLAPGHPHVRGEDVSFRESY